MCLEQTAISSGLSTEPAGDIGKLGSCLGSYCSLGAQQANLYLHLSALIVFTCWIQLCFELTTLFPLSSCLSDNNQQNYCRFCWKVRATTSSVLSSSLLLSHGVQCQPMKWTPDFDQPNAECKPHAMAKGCLIAVSGAIIFKPQGEQFESQSWQATCRSVPWTGYPDLWRLTGTSFL